MVKQQLKPRQETAKEAQRGALQFPAVDESRRRTFS
jgi:hypothetical protein